jgi:hypothetical protein
MAGIIGPSARAFASRVRKADHLRGSAVGFVAAEELRADAFVQRWLGSQLHQYPRIINTERE